MRHAKIEGRTPSVEFIFKIQLLPQRVVYGPIRNCTVVPNSSGQRRQQLSDLSWNYHQQCEAAQP